LVRFHGEAAACAVEEAAIGYQSPSVIAVGANAQNVSVLATLVNLCLSVICLKAPALIEKIGLTKRGAIILAFVNIMTWVPLVIVFTLSQFGIAPAWVAVLWLLNIIPAMLLSFQKDNWLSNIVPGQIMGRYLGQRLAIKSGIYLAAFFAFGYLMDAMGENNLANFGVVFVTAMIMTFVYFYIFTHMHDPKKPEAIPAKVETPKEKFGLLNYVGELKTKHLDHFVLFTSLINISIGLSAPFYAVYMLQEQSFSYMSYTIIISVEFLARVISGPFWGKFADKEGNIKVLKIVSRIVPALPLCWLFSTNIGYLAAVQILSGICWGAFDLSTQSYLYKVAPPQKKLRYIVYTRSLMLFSVALGGIAGSFLVSDIFATFGSRLLTVFMISGFLRAAIVMFLMPKLIDLAIKYGIPQVPDFGFKLHNTTALSKHGLFYHKTETVETPVKANIISAPEPALSRVSLMQQEVVMRQRLEEAEAAKRQLKDLTEIVKNGRQRAWAVKETVLNPAIKTLKLEPAMAMSSNVRRDWLEKVYKEKHVEEPIPPEELKPVRRPWYKDNEILANYQPRVPVLAMAATGATETAAGMNGMNMSAVDKAAGRNGLFHNDAGWAHYKEQSLQAYVKEKKERIAAASTKSPFIESSYPWRNTY